MKNVFTLLAILFAASTTTVLAHPGHEVASGAAAGLMHPLTGLDHLIALVCVGALLAGTSRRVQWQGLVSLVGALAVGATLGLAGLLVPAAEWMIALSVLVTGLVLLTAGIQERPMRLFSGIALFALFHGYAHGVEATGASTVFVLAFLAASASVVGIAIVATASVRVHVTRVALGVSATVVGAALLVSTMDLHPVF